MTDVSPSAMVEPDGTAGVELNVAGSASRRCAPHGRRMPVSAEDAPGPVTLQVCVDELGPPPAGWVADAQGRWRRFRGWMGFLGAVSALLDPASPATRDGEVGGASVG